MRLGVKGTGLKAWRWGLLNGVDRAVRGSHAGIYLGVCAAKREGNKLKAFKKFCLQKSSRQGQNLAWIGPFFSKFLDGGVSWVHARFVPRIAFRANSRGTHFEAFESNTDGHTNTGVARK